ncbi:MAG: carboxymuconolactone decarboxylase family protein [Candidatus Nanohaloarchaea archaeon]
MGDPIDDEHMEATKLFREGSGEIKEGYEEWQEDIREETDFDPKMRELISLAAAASTQCKFCVHSHGQKALKHGASKEEVAQVVQLAAQVRAGATMSYGLEALEHAEE